MGINTAITTSNISRQPLPDLILTREHCCLSYYIFLIGLLPDVVIYVANHSSSTKIFTPPFLTYTILTIQLIGSITCIHFNQSTITSNRVNRCASLSLHLRIKMLLVSFSYRHLIENPIIIFLISI